VIDATKAEDTLEASLERSLHEKIESVDCPSGVEVDPGATFACEVVFSSGSRGTATLRIRNKDADVTVVGLNNDQTERGE
jgi:NAD(P)H-hydrate repair Nnr-like enzyme with NAD(P)H-hydrate epimerase domain